MQDISIRLPVASSVIVQGDTTLLEHAEMSGLGGEDSTCKGEQAIEIRKVTYLGQAGVSICTCSGCGRNILMPGQNLEA